MARNWLEKAVEDARAEGRVVSETKPANFGNAADELAAAPGDMLEKEFQTRVIEWAQGRGWLVAHFMYSAVLRRDGSVTYRTAVAADGKGFPDLVLVRGDRLLFAELKSAKGRVRPDQDRWLLALTGTLASVFIWRPEQWDEIAEVLR